MPAFLFLATVFRFAEKIRQKQAIRCQKCGEKSSSLMVEFVKLTSQRMLLCHQLRQISSRAEQVHFFDQANRVFRNVGIVGRTLP